MKENSEKTLSRKAEKEENLKKEKKKKQQHCEKFVVSAEHREQSENS